MISFWVRNPPTKNNLEFTEGINNHIPFYQNILILGDFNMATENIHLNDLMQNFILNLLIIQHILILY